MTICGQSCPCILFGMALARAGRKADAAMRESTRAPSTALRMRPSTRRPSASGGQSGQTQTSASPPARRAALSLSMSTHTTMARRASWRCRSGSDGCRNPQQFRLAAAACICSFGTLGAGLGVGKALRLVSTSEPTADTSSPRLPTTRAVAPTPGRSRPTRCRCLTCLRRGWCSSPAAAKAVRVGGVLPMPYKTGEGVLQTLRTFRTYRTFRPSAPGMARTVGGLLV